MTSPERWARRCSRSLWLDAIRASRLSPLSSDSAYTHLPANGSNAREGLSDGRGRWMIRASTSPNASLHPHRRLSCVRRGLRLPMSIG